MTLVTKTCSLFKGGTLQKNVLALKCTTEDLFTQFRNGSVALRWGAEFQAKGHSFIKEQVQVTSYKWAGGEGVEQMVVLT